MRPCWSKGWPTKPGLYLVVLANKDYTSFTIERSTMKSRVGEFEQDVPCLVARDGMDGVCYMSGDANVLEEYWGKANAHYGPIPKRRKCK